MAQGVRDAMAWRYGSDKNPAKPLARRLLRTSASVRGALRRAEKRQAAGERLSESELWILDNCRLLRSANREAHEAVKSFRKLPSVFSPQNESVLTPRAYMVALGFLKAVDFQYHQQDLALYLEGIQQVESLQVKELWALKPALQLGMLEQIAADAEEGAENGNRPTQKSAGAESRASGRVRNVISSLRALGEDNWKEFFEDHSATERVLREDPSGTYPLMDYDSRDLYRRAVEEFASQSLFSEEEVARTAVLLARRAKAHAKRHDSRMSARRADLGYYLIAEGSRLLKRRLGCRPPLMAKLRQMILDWPEIYYIVGVELTTIGLVFVLLRSLGIAIPLIPGLLLLIPASHAAVGLVNRLTTFLIPPRRLPKLDFSEGVPPDCTTLVAVPCLLLNEKAVRHNIESLEVRYLGNRDPNVHFALLTDPPDASQRFDKRDELVGLCSTLIGELNRKYAGDGKGGFFHLHRHRVHNPAEGTWMGWERKRGKLLDLNKLLLGTSDSFPVKVGDLSVLRQVRFVITLDADTQLPRDTAYRLIGALAHPLNRAIVDPATNTVVDGYTILQPRVSVSIESARHSRLASIYSGQTGFDIYTRAISDVYQDLFGEGSFTGKGIYEVATFQRALGKRFPTNALLSHDLIEGAYARAGLVSDVEVIDDYPSHFSAYCRRLHRWVRGDWQIMRWVFPRVPDYFGRSVPNPLTFLSRWKILDNLRRSLNDVGLFLLLVAGWTFLPGGPVYWTLVTLALLLMPTYFELLFSLLRVGNAKPMRGFLRERWNDFMMGHLQVFIMLAFLPHQALVMLDAITRTLVRVNITHRKLLEWETAAEAEVGSKGTSPVEVYLALTPWLALAVGLVLAACRPVALFIASPVLALWLLADAFTHWVNQQPRSQTRRMSRGDDTFLRAAGLRTWRFFREFGGPKTNGLIPDSVQESPPLIASRISPTNLGLLLNARLAAHGLGYLTLKEFAGETERTLECVWKLERFRGHFLNWYDTQTLEPLEPLFVSTVDSGNLAACLWTLGQSCLGLPSKPLLARGLWQGLRDHLTLLLELSKVSAIPAEIGLIVRDLAARVEPLGDEADAWVGLLAGLEEGIHEVLRLLSESDAPHAGMKSESPRELVWWANETLARLHAIEELLHDFIPWALPEYALLSLVEESLEVTTLESIPQTVSRLEKKLSEISNDGRSDETLMAAARSLQRRLAPCARNASELSQQLRRLADGVARLVDEMEFRFLYDAKRKLFSVGYDVKSKRLAPYSYDLLASEARTAVLLAIAKGDVPQEAWFHLGRTQTLYRGERVLLSWSGTMFEYLMPTLWMRSYPGTILDHTARAAVRCQQKYAQTAHCPWGISEAAYSNRDHQGSYQYHAFGVRELALDPHAAIDLVVAPYASFLALAVDPFAATRNLAAMERLGCLGAYGFYESCECRPAGKYAQSHCQPIRSWMAHHQGMILLALCNLFDESSIRKWFHHEPRVLATELLLHEKVPLMATVEANPLRPHSPAGFASGQRHSTPAFGK